jgi:hypothetical protein
LGIQALGSLFGFLKDGKHDWDFGTLSFGVAFGIVAAIVGLIFVVLKRRDLRHEAFKDARDERG